MVPSKFWPHPCVAALLSTSDLRLHSTGTASSFIRRSCRSNSTTRSTRTRSSCRHELSRRRRTARPRLRHARRTHRRSLRRVAASGPRARTRRRQRHVPAEGPAPRSSAAANPAAPLRSFRTCPAKRPGTPSAFCAAARTPNEVILLTAHLDHLGMGLAVTAGDTIYNGADDDASGTTAVLTLAHILAIGPASQAHHRLRPLRLGGARRLRQPRLPRAPAGPAHQHRRQPRVRDDRPARSGRPRRNALAHRLRALQPWPRTGQTRRPPRQRPPPRRSTSSSAPTTIALAQQGIVAHTVSSFGLHKDYHQPSDELSTIDFTHMTNAIESMIAPIRWLANSNWKPEWNPGGKTRCHSARQSISANISANIKERPIAGPLFLPLPLRSREVEAIRGSSPCSRPPQSHARRPAASRRTHTLPQGLGAESSTRRRDRRLCLSTSDRR